MKDKRFFVIWFRILLFSYIVKWVSLDLPPGIWIKASYHKKLPLVGFAEKKKYFLSWLDYVSDIPF